MKKKMVTLLYAFSLSICMVLPASGDFLSGRGEYLLGHYDKAMKEFKADNSPQSLYQVGYMYSHGEGVPKDEKEAAEWYRKAAERGYAPAQYRLGVFYANGYGVEQDTKEAVKWYKKAADQGFQPAKEAFKKMEKAK